MKNTSLIAILFLALPLAQAQQTSQQVRQHFQNPSKAFRPIVRWWWPGNDVTTTELDREIGVLDKAGFGGAEIQPFSIGLEHQPLTPAQRALVNGYATPSFFRNVASTVEEARKHGLFIDYTFGSGWPFGGGNDITPELVTVELRSSHHSMIGPARFHGRLQLPAITDGDPAQEPSVLKKLPAGWIERLQKRTKVVAVVAIRGENTNWDKNQIPNRERPVFESGKLVQGSSIDLTSKMQPDGTLDWDVPEGTWQVFVFSSVPTVHTVVGSAGTGPQLELDHFNAAAFAAHAKHVGDAMIPYAGQYFGNGMRAVFCDSLEVITNLYWSDDFLQEFRRRRGYDLIPYLPLLKVQGYDQPFEGYDNLPPFDMPGIGDQVRRDYHQTVSDLMTERFYNQFNNWAHAHHLLARTQSHGAPADVMRVYGEADIPETEDLFDEGRYDFLKMAASAAHVYGRSIVGSESFVWREGAYQTTPEKVKIAADELLTAGINGILYHGFPYIIPGLKKPGWHPFVGFPGESYSSQMNELNPYFSYIAPLNSYITRVQYISQTGKNVAQVAIYQYELQHSAHNPPPPSVPPLNQNIMDAGYNYDHIDINSLLNAKVENGSLITSGGAHYRFLVLPNVQAIDAQLIEKLEGFARAGLHVIFFGEPPAQADGLLDAAAKTERVRTAMRSMHGMHSVSFVSTPEEATAVMLKAASPDIQFHSKPLPYFHKQIGNIDAYFLRNASDVEQPLHATFQAEGVPELWNPWTGDTATIQTFGRSGKSVRVDLDIQPYGSAMIAFDHSASTASLPPPLPKELHLVTTDAIGAKGWDFSATGMLPSGPEVTIKRTMPDLADWSLDPKLRGFSGKGTYTTHFTVPDGMTGKQFMLDLGDVESVAVVTVNGKQAGTLLLHPYYIDVTNLLHTGDNTLQIEVTDGLFNMMVLRKPRTFVVGRTENPSGLMSAGLIGPVQLRVMQQ